MATTRLVIDGYGQIELNNVAFRRDGRIEAQCAPSTTDFSNAKVENGMLLAVDAVARVISVPTDDSLPVALNYSAEHIYDERTPGLKSFALNAVDDFYPRLGYLAVGDKFTTNCVSFDSAKDSTWTSQSAFVSALGSYATVPLYGGIGSDDGSILVSASTPTQGPKLKVVEKTTMPDGTLGIKFQVITD